MDKTLLDELTELWEVSYKEGDIESTKDIEKIVNDKYTPEAIEAFRENIERIKGEEDGRK